MSGKCTFGCSNLRTRPLVQKSPKTRTLCTLGRGWAVEKGGGRVKGSSRRERTSHSFGFLINSVWPSLSVFSRGPPTDHYLLRPYICSLLLLFISTHTFQSSDQPPEPLPTWESSKARTSGGLFWPSWSEWPSSFSLASPQLSETRTTATPTRRWRCPWPLDLPLPHWPRA